MISVKNNYRHSYKDLSCPFGCQEIDTQEHMLISCDKMTCNITEKEYNVFFAQDDEVMSDVINKVEVIQNDRIQLLED